LNNCYNNGSCEVDNITSQSSCKCNKGFYGEYCQFKECDEQCILNNGQCIEGKCHCPNNKIGHNCSITFCKNYCNNNGICVKDSNDKYVCTCNEDYFGEYCQHIKCDKNCNGNGVCIEVDN